MMVTIGLSKTIIDKFGEKGYNLYRRGGVERIGAEAVIQRGPVSELEVGVGYVMLPKVADLRDPKQVYDRIAMLGFGGSSNNPGIMLAGTRWPMSGFTLREFDVTMHTPDGMEVLYPFFLRYLETLSDANYN